MELFRESDKVVIRWPEQELPPEYGDWGDDLEPGETFEVVRYVASLEVLRDRLAIHGFTLENASRLFTEAARLEIASLERRLAKIDYPILVEEYGSQIELLKTLTPESWIENFREIYDGRLSLKYHSSNKHPDPTIEYMLRQEWHGCPGPERNVAVRLAIEACSAEQKMVYDLTDLVQGGYFTAEDTLVSISMEDVADRHRSASKIIILTEGKSDSRILERSLHLLFPHLADYYSFLEFDSVRYGGGAGNLVNTLKAFAGAGISNRIIALFDNDTAAASAILGVADVDLPSHIRIIQLPPIDLLREYPTLGPTGMARMDVNGLASSLELFLGEDVLQMDGELSPVQWTGYDARLKRYQGEVVRKEELQSRFSEKLKEARSLDGVQWRDLRAVFRSIFAAFDEFSITQIERDIKNWYGQQ